MATKDTVLSARHAMMEAKYAAMAAAYCVEDITGVRIVRTDEVMYGQEVDQVAAAREVLVNIPEGERSERAVAALESLEGWVEARALYGEVGADAEGMVQVWAANVRAVDAYKRVEALSE